MPAIRPFATTPGYRSCSACWSRFQQPRPLPIYASEACWEAGPNKTFQYLAERSGFRPLEPWSPVALDDLSVMPFPVDHGPKAPGAMGFVVRHGPRRVVIDSEDSQGRRWGSFTVRPSASRVQVTGSWEPSN